VKFPAKLLTGELALPPLKDFTTVANAPFETAG
jgi:hypothetical protein